MFSKNAFDKYESAPEPQKRREEKRREEKRREDRRRQDNVR